MYTKDPETLEARIQRDKEKELEKKLKIEKRKRKELARRRNYERLVMGKPCIGDPDTGVFCPNTALVGSPFCIAHGGSISRHREIVVLRMMAMVEPALKTVLRCMSSSDEKVALNAAQILLDRVGLGPTAKVYLEEKKEDYSGMSDRQLVERAQKLLMAIDQNEEIKANGTALTAEIKAIH